MAHTRFNEYITKTIAAEINRFSKYYDSLVQIDPLDGDKQTLLENIECPSKETVTSISASPKAKSDKRQILLLNGNLNYEMDIQSRFDEAYETMSRNDRLVAILFNPYFRWVYRLAEFFNIKRSSNAVTFITNSNLKNLTKLSNFEIVRLRNAVYVPFKLFGLGDFINALLPTIPLIRWVSMATVVVLRPIKASTSKPSLSVIVPARNEAGNIENCLAKLPKISGTKIEVIFVEGNSSDNTWDEIQRVIKLEKYQHFTPVAFQQPGKGKKDAVMVGFDNATCDLVTILDADLTMPPEALPRFYDAYLNGMGDMVNGNRQMYPMEDEAMRFLNRLGNLFFAKALSRVLDISIGDSLCGTKLISREDHFRYLRWLEDFGDFDPFGDFQLLFPSAELCLGTVDVPIAYKARTYGSTNINRFRDGWILLKMTFQGFIKIKTGATPK